MKHWLRFSPAPPWQLEELHEGSPEKRNGALVWADSGGAAQSSNKMRMAAEKDRRGNGRQERGKLIGLLRTAFLLDKRRLECNHYSTSSRRCFRGICWRPLDLFCWGC